MTDGDAIEFLLTADDPDVRRSAKLLGATIDAAQTRIAELTKSLDRKNDVVEGWRDECAEHADARATAEKRIAELEAALCDIIAENPNPNLPYGHRVNEIARAALAGDEPATRGE